MNNLNGTCPHICAYKENGGYCRHTVCINPRFKSNTSYATNSSTDFKDNAELNTYCIAENCQKASVCARHISKAPAGKAFPVVNYFAYGTGTVSCEGVSISFSCGEVGNWGMFLRI